MSNTKKMDKGLDEIRGIVSSSKRYDVSLTNKWEESFPDEAGLLIFFEGNKVVYIGETGSIARRLKNLSQTRLHALRRRIAVNNFLQEKAYVKGSGRYTSDIELKINNYLITKVKFNYLLVDENRKELKKLAIVEYEPKYNSF